MLSLLSKRPSENVVEVPFSVIEAELNACGDKREKLMELATKHGQESIWGLMRNVWLPAKNNVLGEETRYSDWREDQNEPMDGTLEHARWRNDVLRRVMAKNNPQSPFEADAV